MKLFTNNKSALYYDELEDLCFLELDKNVVKVPNSAIIKEKTFSEAVYFEEYFTMSKAADFLVTSNGFLVNKNKN